MKEKQNKRWGLKLLSLLCAFLVWLGVVNVADPVITKTVEIPVEIVNEDVLTKNNLTYEITGKKTATISYEVKTTNAYRIHASDFRAYADMTEYWTVTGAIPVRVEVLSRSEYLVSTPVSKMATISIKTEPLLKKRFEINTEIVGELEDGYEIGATSLGTSYTFIEGPESLLKRIDRVGVEINADGGAGDLGGMADLQYYDEEGNKIALSDRLVTDLSEVSYQVTVLKVKNLTLDFQVSGNVADGYRFTGVSSDVKAVPVAGMKSSLASLHTIVIPGDVLDVTGAKGNITKTVNLENYLPENVTIAGMMEHEIEVVMTVEKLEERVFTVDAREITLEGEKEEYIYRPVQGSISIRVRGLKEDLDKLKIEADELSVNVSEMAEGKNTSIPELKLNEAFEVLGVAACDINVLRVPSESDESGEADEPGVEESSKSAETSAVPVNGEPTAGATEAKASEPAETSAAG